MTENMGKRLEKLRKKHDYSQQEVADFLVLSQSQLAKVESNKRNLKLSEIIQLCNLYNVEEEYILYGKGNLNEDNTLFKKENDHIDLNTIARMNRITNNLIFMKHVYNENYSK